MRESRVTLTKCLAVRRSGVVPTLYWWTLPLPVHRLVELYPDALTGARALVWPSHAVTRAADLHPRVLPGDVALVADPGALLAARDQGRVAPCTIALFPAGIADTELEKRAAGMRDGFENLPFTIALRPEGDGRARHHYCFRVPGKVIAALEFLALERGFGGNAGQVEMALLQGLNLRPAQSTALQLRLLDGRALLGGISAGGRRRITYLESGKGFTGVDENLPFRRALEARLREAWRRFPVGVVMFAGLPFFIAAFWIARAAGRPGASATAASPPGSAASR